MNDNNNAKPDPDKDAIYTGIFASMGELLLRLKPMGHERLLQKPFLEACFGGSEANVAISLANFGLRSRFITALPANAIGNAAIAFLRSFNIDVDSIIKYNNSRMGLYFMELGSGPRPSRIIYDRAHSAIYEALVPDFDWDKIFNGVSWFHISGITPGLSIHAADLTIHAVNEAKIRDIIVSCDLNYRAKLWNYGKKPIEIMKEILPKVDILIGNESDIQKCMNISVDNGDSERIIDGQKDIPTDYFEKLALKVIDSFPNIKYVAISLRKSYSVEHNDWSGMLYSSLKRTPYFSKIYRLHHIIDRVGAGDSFAAGLIYAMAHILKRNLTPRVDPAYIPELATEQDAIEFAAAASALKHTIPGDVNRSSVREVLDLMLNSGSGRIRR